MKWSPWSPSPLNGMDGWTATSSSCFWGETKIQQQQRVFKNGLDREGFTARPGAHHVINSRERFSDLVGTRQVPPRHRHGTGELARGHSWGGGLPAFFSCAIDRRCRHGGENRASIWGIWIGTRGLKQAWLDGMFYCTPYGSDGSKDPCHGTWTMPRSG